MSSCCFNISTSIMLKPVVIECGHRCFDSCSKRLAEGPMTKRKCPSCRWPIDSDQGLSVYIALTSMLSSFAVKCKNEGCECNGRLGDSPFHEKGCMFKKVDCEFRSQGYTVKCRRQWLFTICTSFLFWNTFWEYPGGSLIKILSDLIRSCKNLIRFLLRHEILLRFTRLSKNL